MTQIEAEPKHMFSWGFVLSVNSQYLTTIDMAWLKEGGEFYWNTEVYKFNREGFMSGDFLLTKNNETIARATKPNPFTRRFVLHLENRELILAANSPFTRCFTLTENDMETGSIRPNHPLTRRTTIVFPENLNVPVQVFIFWLVVLMWRRAANNNS